MGLYKVESQFRVVEAEVKSGGREQGSRRKGFALVIKTKRYHDRKP